MKWAEFIDSLASGGGNIAVAIFLIVFGFTLGFLPLPEAYHDANIDLISMTLGALIMALKGGRALQMRNGKPQSSEPPPSHEETK